MMNQDDCMADHYGYDDMYEGSGPDWKCAVCYTREDICCADKDAAHCKLHCVHTN